MKNFILFVLVFITFATYAYSAELETISEVQDSDLSLMSQLHQSTHAAFDGCALVIKERIISKKENETWDKVIKQIIYKNNTDYSTPEGGVLLNKLPVNRFMILSVFTSQSFFHYGNKNNGEEKYLNNIRQFHSVLENKSLDQFIIYEGYHSSSFGASSFGALVDLENNEVIIFQAGYCE